MATITSAQDKLQAPTRRIALVRRAAKPYVHPYLGGILLEIVHTNQILINLVQQQLQQP